MQSRLAERCRDKRPKTINSAPSAGLEREGHQKARGLSQEELADLAGLHRASVGVGERAETHTSIDNIEEALRLWTSGPEHCSCPQTPGATVVDWRETATPR